MKGAGRCSGRCGELENSLPPVPPQTLTFLAFSAPAPHTLGALRVSVAGWLRRESQMASCRRTAPPTCWREPTGSSPLPGEALVAGCSQMVC